MIQLHACNLLQTLVEAVRSLWRKYNAAAKELKSAVSTVRGLRCLAFSLPQ
jgi:hypothetical protein